MEDQLIFGRKPIADAIDSGMRFEKIFYQANLKSDEINAIVSSAKASKIACQEVPKEKLQDILYKSKVRDANHQGIMGFISLIDYKTIEDILNIAESRNEPALVVVLDGITDVHNFAAIARSAECFGAHGIILQYANAAPVNAVALKISAGALTKIPVCREQSLLSAIKILRAHGLKIYGAESTESTTIETLNLKEPLAIIMGAEGDGIANVVKKHCDKLVSIPMSGSTDSLNVSVSAGVFLYEINRQRK